MQKNVEKRIAEKLGISLTEADTAFNAVLEALKEEIVEDQNLQLRGFGSFKTVRSKERQGRNPGTGAAITIAAKNRLKFVPGKYLKAAIQ